MNPESLLLLGTVVLAATFGGRAQAAESPATCVRVIAIEVDPAQLGAYQSALKEEISASVNSEAGVLAIYAVAEKDHPNQLHLFELYTDDAAYKAHQGSAGFQKYKAATQKMIRSRKVIEAAPIILGTK
jgi:quinol monooxygenase YgiN